MADIQSHITVTETDDYLRFHVTGTDSLQFSIDYFSAVARECKQRGYAKALIVEELHGQLSNKDMYSLCEKFPDILYGIQVAFVDLDPDHLHENSFGETVAFNRGCNVRVFENEGDAVTWLTSA